MNPSAPEHLQHQSPFIWPDPRVLTGTAHYAETPPFRRLLASADLISAVLVGADDRSIAWLQEVLRTSPACKLSIVLVLPPAGATRAEHLRAIHLLQSSQTNATHSLEARVLPLRRSYGADFERFALLPTTIVACNTQTGDAVMNIGSVGDAGNDPFCPASLNVVFQPGDALQDEWRRWFQFVFECGTPLTEDSIHIPRLVPAEGSPEAAAQWAEYMERCKTAVESQRMPEVDRVTGEVVKTADGAPVKPWDDGATSLDPLAQVFQKVYAGGWLVTVDETTRIKPLAIPVKATLLGQQAARTIGALTQKQSFSLRILDGLADKAMEKYRKATDLLDILTLPLANSNRWAPEKSRPLLEQEVERRNTAGRAALVQALGGDSSESVSAFIARRRDAFRKDLNGMYQTLGQGEEVPTDKFELVLKEVEERLKAALEARVTPRLVFNRIAAPSLAGAAPDENWSQPLSLLSHAAQAMRESLTDAYFPRKFSGLGFGEKEFRECCNPFDDRAASQGDRLSAKDELEFIERVLAEELPLKVQCQMLWNLTQGMPHFYFETHFEFPGGQSLPDSFAIITAYARTGTMRSEAENRAADSQLEQELTARGYSPIRITGFSPQTKHSEPGWGAALAWTEACDIGQAFNQDAVYVVRADELFVTYCDDRRMLVPLGGFRKRLTPTAETQR